jgi:hypothetical protein
MDRAGAALPRGAAAGALATRATRSHRLSGPTLGPSKLSAIARISLDAVPAKTTPTSNPLNPHPRVRTMA